MIKKITLGIVALALMFSFVVPAAQAKVLAPALHEVSGEWIVAFNYEGADYTHDVTFVQGSDDRLTGGGGSPAGANVYEWTITKGAVSGDKIGFLANYTATQDAVVPQTTLRVVGTISGGGVMSGTWSDNYQGTARIGTWTSTSGNALVLVPASLAAEDFGVVDYDTGLGMLSGYSAGFGLTGATFENAQSVVVKLYSGNTLLQTNTSTQKVGDEINGNQISSPFDVSGNFDYATDGYWTNVRRAEYGQTMTPTKVVAKVTLENGRVVMAENTVLTGDPLTIQP